MFTDLIPGAAPQPAPEPTARERFFRLIETALAARQLVRLTLGRYRGPEADLEKVLARPVLLRGEPHLQLVWRTPPATSPRTTRWPRCRRCWTA